MTRIAVVIPVGPEAHHADYLDEALASVAAQTRKPDVLIAVDDMHGDFLEARILQWGFEKGVLSRVHTPPWRLGVGTAFNTGCAVAFNLNMMHGPIELALMLGADDRLEPRVLEHLEGEFDRQGRDGYYWLDTIYEDGAEQALPCNNAALTAGFLRESGGLPIEASSGGMDAALISAMLVHRPESLIHVTGAQARFWSRQHANQEGRRLGAYFGAMDIIRNVYTETWQPTRWGRYV